MRFFDRQINDISDWPRPVAEHHWAEERSAYELARDWLAGADVRVERLLSSHPAFGGEVHLQWGVAERGPVSPRASTRSAEPSSAPHSTTNRH